MGGVADLSCLIEAAPLQDPLRDPLDPAILALVAGPAAGLQPLSDEDEEQDG
jgi:hypothetical protein